MLSFSLFSSALAVRSADAKDVVSSIANHRAGGSAVAHHSDGSVSWHEKIGLMPFALWTDWVHGERDVIDVTVRNVIVPVSEKDGFKVFAFVAPFEGVRTDFTTFALSAPSVNPCRLAIISNLALVDIAKKRHPWPSKDEPHWPKNHNPPYIRAVSGKSNGSRFSFIVDGTNAGLVDDAYSLFLRDRGLDGSLKGEAAPADIDVRRIDVRMGSWDVAIERNLFSEFSYSGESAEQSVGAVRDMYKYLEPLIRVSPQMHGNYAAA